jgi:hypothetical protein
VTALGAVGSITTSPDERPLDEGTALDARGQLVLRRRFDAGGDGARVVPPHARRTAAEGGGALVTLDYRPTVSTLADPQT